jgi:cytochrome c556
MRNAGRRLIAAGLAVCAVSIPAMSHDHARGVVKERMDMMEAMAKRMIAIGKRIDEKRDLASIKGEAEAIALQAPHLAHLFPPGSTQKPTDAKNTIWKNWSDFERKAAALEAESKKLMNASPDEPAVLAAQFRAVSETCGGCHEKYRVRRRKGDL